MTIPGGDANPFGSVTETWVTDYSEDRQTHQPNAVRHLADADLLPGTDLAEIDLPAVEAEAAAVRDNGRPVVKRIGHLSETSRCLSASSVANGPRVATLSGVLAARLVRDQLLGS